MTKFVTSADGTRIAYDREGSGPVIILVASAFQFRAFDPGTVELGRLLAASGFDVINYDRRGRGESTDTLPFSVDREVEDIAALIGLAGGSAALFGSSSGAALCLWAAASGLDVTGLVLWEAPLSLEGEGDGGEWLIGLQQRIAQGDRGGAVEFFMRDMPAEWLDAVKQGPAWPVMKDVAPTLVYDAAALERAQRRPWAELWATVGAPALVVVGEQTLPLFPPVADALVRALPNASQRRIAAADHGWQPEVMAGAIAGFLRG
jgi:pimeloyl-ACP methyl ester carboxylesterase